MTSKTDGFSVWKSPDGDSRAKWLTARQVSTWLSWPRYCGASLYKTLYAETVILNLTRSGMHSMHQRYILLCQKQFQI